MDLTETNLVRPGDERPNRRDGTCFYCSQPIGQEHKPDCVIVSKTVTVRMTVDLVIQVPRHWDKEAVEFARNESSWCANNIFGELGKWAEGDEHPCGCSCRATSFEFLREATEDDHRELPMLLDE